MEAHFTLTDQEFESQFARCTLNPDIFSHEAHLRLAWIHLYHYGIDEAVTTIPLQLRRYVENLGAADKFNLTLTIAAIRAVHHFMQRSRKDNFQDFIAEFPRLKYNFKELLASHYGFDIYRSEQAKAEFMAPDLQPFD